MSNYSLAKPEYLDIEEAEKDVKVIQEMARQFGFEDRVVLNPSLLDLTGAFNKLEEDILKRGERGEKTLAFVYYAGHGAMRDKLCAVLNVPKS